MRALPKGSVAAPLNSASSSTGLVMPLMVRSPTRVNSSPLTSLMPVETKVISGVFSVSKKSADFRWPSRSPLPVSTESTFMVAVALELANSSATTI